MVESEEEPLEITPIVQIGVVVKNVDKAIDYYSKTFGLGPWNVVINEHLPYAIQRGKRIHYTTKLGFTTLPGGLQVELIEVTKGSSIHLEALKKKGESIHHIAFRVNDVEKEIAKYQKHGFKRLLSMVNDEGKPTNAYFDTDKIGGVLFEISGPPRKETPK